MGFLDNTSNNIILDAVLTDLGRAALARNDGSFSIFKFAFGDDEVDYNHIVTHGRTVGKEKIEKNTPILEATTQASLGIKYRLRSLNNSNLTRLPTLELATSLASDIMSLSRTGTSAANPTQKTITVEQRIQGAGTMDPDLIDYSYRVDLDNRFLSISNRVPDSISDDQVATYTIECNPTLTAQNTSSITLTIGARNTPDSLFSTYKQFGGSVVERVCTISGVNSGAFKSFRIQIS